MAFENAVAAGSDATDQYHPVVGEIAAPETVAPTADPDAPSPTCITARKAALVACFC